MLRVVLQVLKYLIKGIKGFENDALVTEEYERLVTTKKIIYEAW